MGIVQNQHSPRMGKRIIIPFTPFATLQWWAVILLPPSGAYPCCILSPRALPRAGISMPLRGVTNTHPQPLPKGGEIEAYTNSDRRTKEHNTPSLREGWGGLHITLNPSPREGSVDGWGKYGLKGQNKSAQGNALGIVHNQHSPRMGKRIIIPFTPFATLQWWAVILLPPSGAYPCCIQFPGRCPGLAYQCPFGA